MKYREERRAILTLLYFGVTVVLLFGACLDMAVNYSFYMFVLPAAWLLFLPVSAKLLKRVHYKYAIAVTTFLTVIVYQLVVYAL